jgi:hypothetical protein
VRDGCLRKSRDSSIVDIRNKENIDVDVNKQSQTLFPICCQQSNFGDPQTSHDVISG